MPRANNKQGVYITRSEVFEAFRDLLAYYESLEEPTQNTETAREVLKEILTNETSRKWSNNNGLGGDWHFSNIIEIESFFEEQGKKYGLIKEFRENWII